MQKKFTLIELIIVIVVIGILAAMALPKVTGIVQDARISAMINDKETLEKVMLLHYQKYDNLPILNEDQELIVLNDDISLIKLVQAEEVNEDMATIYTSLQETLNHYNDEEEYLYRIDLSKIKESLSKGLKYGNKRTDKDFYVYSTKTNNIYYYEQLMNKNGTIQHSEYDTLIKKEENKDIVKIKSPLLDNDGIVINNKPIVELTTNLEELKVSSIINWVYNFIDEDETPTKISFFLNDVEYDNFDSIPTQLEEGEYTIKLKMQDKKGLWSDEIIKTFSITSNARISGGIGDLGSSHFLKIGNDGKLYAWGSGTYGKLGLGNSTNKTSPQLVNLPNEEEPFYVSAGCDSSLVVTKKGNLYSCGLNQYGQLGIGSTTDKSIFMRITLPDEEKATSVVAGRNSSIVITEKGNLYTWGLNGYGQLGIGNTTTKTTPQKVTIPNGEKPVSMFMSEYFTMVITDKENLYSWGWNREGQLGLGTTVNHSTPQKVTLPNEEKPSSIFLGYNHSVLVTKSGNLYTCGDNYYGQLGLGNNTDKSTFQKVTLPNNEKVLSAQTESNHSMLLTNEGTVYTWGDNYNGPLGTGGNGRENAPRKVEGRLKNEYIVDILVGFSTSVALTKDNKVYAWGNNNAGMLNYPTMSNLYLPVEITLP